MVDDVAPYSRAVEETAKSAGKAMDLVRDGAHAISRPVANIYGLLIGDQIEASRERNLDAISRKTKKILVDRDLSETSPVTEQIAIPLLEAARGETREEMQTLWAQLLANAMDPARRNDVRPEFIDVLRNFHPVDAVVLEWLGTSNRPENWHAADVIRDGLKIRQSSAVVTLGNLANSGCARKHQTGAYQISDFGAELLLACRA